MRLKYYLTTIRQMRIKKSFVLLLIMIILFTIIFTIIYYKNVKPTLKTLSEMSVKSLALKSANQAVRNSIQGINYEDLINMQKGNDGKIISIFANVVKMNEISNQVVINTQEEIEKASIDYIKMPLGSFLGIDILAGHGVKFKLNTLPTGICTAEFKSTFDNAGINQTLHRINLVVNVELQTIAPFFSDIQTYTNEIAIAETVIVGDTPSTYYEIQGIADLSQKDALEVIQ